jgi:CheY-like chemotaxis protein
MAGRQPRALLRPGDTAPSTGVYTVTHRRHRLPHEVSLLKGDLLPACKRCGQHVRYRLNDPVENGKGLLPAKPSLLLVETEDTVSFTLRRILETSGYSVMTAASYRQAADLLRRCSFDVVLTEVDLERGSEGLRLAMEAKRLQPPPVVVLSASQPTEQGLRAALGLANYLVLKPIDLSELQNALGTMLARRQLSSISF